MPDLVAAIDAGTTSTRCILFNQGGAAVANAQKEHRQITPRPGWLEHDPQELWTSTAAVVAEAMAMAGACAADLAAVGLTNQRETTLLWERGTGRPVSNAIVWSDARTAELCDQLKSDGGIDRFRQATGLPIATYFSAAKLAWLLQNVPNARRRAGRGELCFGTVDTWLLWHLTGKFVTDLTNASRTMLMGLHECDWRDDLLETFGIPREVLPQIQPSIGGGFGSTRADGPFAGEVPVTAVLGDQQAALFGQCCFDVGQAKNTYGTGCFLLMNTGGRAVHSRHGLLTTPAYQVAGSQPVYALEGSVAVAGSLVQWLRDNLGFFARSADVETLAGGVADSGGVYFVPALGGLFAPHWDSSARGTIVGITAQTSRAHIARAALDATCFQTADVFDAMTADSGRSLEVLNVDGGMAVNDRLLQFQADVLGVPVARPAYTESTAAGAAQAAGLATGFWRSVSELRGARRIERTFDPHISEDERRNLRLTWRKAVDRSRDWIETHP
jgi:glycerol kinase